MWYLDARKYRPGMYDDRLTDPEFQNAWGGFDPNRVLSEARIHGNPFIDCGVIGWEDSTAVKRAENEAYEQATEAGGDSTGFDMELFDLMAAIASYTLGSIMILDADDPELLECSATELEERLTSHIAEPYRHPEAWPEWAIPTFKYVEKMFLATIESGHVPGAILVEPIRQRMGFPYEWLGPKGE